MSSKAKHYASKSSEEALSVLSEKLGRDLRKTIQNVVFAPHHSTPWKAQLESLGRIAEVTEMERYLPCKHEDPSLWEGEEQALRCVLEEGKLNFLSRMLVDFKESQYGVETSKVTPSVSESKGSEEADESWKTLDLQFERAVGRITLNAWRHVECLQSADVPLLVNLISTVAQAAVRSKEKRINWNESEVYEFGCQEEFILETFQLLMDAITDEVIPEDRVLTWVRKEKAAQSVVKHLYCNQTRISSPFLECGLDALSSLVESEGYTTNPEHFFTDQDGVEELLQLAPLVEDLSRLSSENKTRFRPISLEIATIKRNQRK